jgi:hypothetical protein
VTANRPWSCRLSSAHSPCVARLTAYRQQSYFPDCHISSVLLRRPQSRGVPQWAATLVVHHSDCLSPPSPPCIMPHPELSQARRRPPCSPHMTGIARLALPPSSILSPARRASMSWFLCLAASIPAAGGCALRTVIAYCFTHRLRWSRIVAVRRSPRLRHVPTVCLNTTSGFKPKRDGEKVRARRMDI